LGGHRKGGQHLRGKRALRAPGDFNLVHNSSWSPATGPLLDRTELENSLAILVPPHRPLRLDECVNGENPAGAARELDLEALSEHPIVAADAQDLAKAVELPAIRLQVQVPELGSGLRSEAQWRPLGWHPVDRVKVGERGLEAHEVLGSEWAADVDILREQRDAMGDGGKPSDHHELDRVADQSIEEGLKIRQRGAPWPLSTRARPRGLDRAS